MEKKKKKRILLGVLAFVLLAGIAGAGAVYYYLFAPQFHPQKTTYVYIDRDDTADSIYNKVKTLGKPNSFIGFKWMAQWRKYPRKSTPDATRYVPVKTSIMYSAASTEDTKNP